MLDLSEYPLALQILMQTDGTVTNLIRLLAKEEINVIKLHELTQEIDNESVLNRHIYLQGQTSKVKWLYAESKIYLDRLPQEFIDDLFQKSLPIGRLWNKHKIETFKKLTKQFEEHSGNSNSLVRVYEVFNKNHVIMEIMEKFQINNYMNLI